MTSSSPLEHDHSWLNDLSTNREEVAAYYDSWAEDYDQTLAQWHYQSPSTAATLLKQRTPLEGRILDAGCGTGLSGCALQAVGFRHITGVDVSQISLNVARQSGAYERLLQVDMQQLPLPFETAEFAGLQCVGVLTYIPDTAAILREFCRLVRPGGLVVFTQRDDLFSQRDYPGVIQRLEHDRMWEPISVSEPQLYLPGNVDFADKIKVIYCVCRRT